MFATSLQEIYRKINGMEEPKKKEAFLYLESQILGNNALKYQFELLNFVKKHRNSIINQESFSKFVKEIREKNINFISESKLSHLKIYKENKKLLEYFNINPKELNVSTLDLAVDVYSNAKSLNETALKQIVVKENLNDTKKVEFKMRMKSIKESFSSLIKTKNKKELRTNFKIINFLSECMNPKQQQLTQASAISLYEANQKNPGDYSAYCNKLFKLRVISEKIIREGIEDDPNDYSDWYKKGKIAPEDKVKAKSGGVISSKQDLKYLKAIKIEAPANKNHPSKLILRFSILFYPLGHKRNEALTSAAEMAEKLIHFERLFLNSTIFQNRAKVERLKFIDPVGTIWLSELQKWQKQAPGEENRINIEVYLNTNLSGGDFTWSDYETTCYDMLKDFDTALPGLLEHLAGLLEPSGKTKGVKKDELLAKYFKNPETGTSDNTRPKDNFKFKIPTRNTVRGSAGGIF